MHLQSALNPEISLRMTAYYNMGLAYLDLSRDDEAIGAFNQSLRLDPQDPDTHHYLGLAYLEKKRYDEAITCQSKCRAS